MLQDKVIAIYCSVDDLLKEMNHKEHNNRKITDGQVITYNSKLDVILGQKCGYPIHFLGCIHDFYLGHFRIVYLSRNLIFGARI